MPGSTREGRNFCYAGHTDVVPTGDPAAWQVDPFSGAEVEDKLYGRGAVDMKGSIAAFLAALAAFLKERGPDFDGSISLLITGDEEAAAINGTRKVLGWMQDRGETISHCLVGEPTSNARLGDMVKIGRRGAMNGRLTVHGIQGHSAYADLAENPVHHLVAMLSELLAEPLDQGSEHFPPTSLQIVSVDVGNPTTNVIPREAKAVFDCRFSDQHSSASVERWIKERLERRGARFDMDIRVSGESFLTPPGLFSDLVSSAVAGVCGQPPELGTTGGTSDARFIKDHAPVVELGLLNGMAHKVDEHVPLSDCGRSPPSTGRSCTATSTDEFERAMIPSVAEIASSIFGVWRLAHLDKSALQYFNRSVEGFWRSFFAAVITLPGYAILMALQFQSETVTAESAKVIIVLGLTYVLAWTVIPLVMYSLTQAMGRSAEYIGYIVALNWAQVPLMLVYVPIVGIEAAGFLPAAFGETLSFVALLGLLFFEGYIAHTALRIGAMAATGIVILSFVIVQVIGAVGLSLLV